MFRNLLLSLALLSVATCCTTSQGGKGGLVADGGAPLLKNHAFLVTAQGLVAVREGQTKQHVLTAKKPSWCVVDNRSLVVWYTVDTGKNAVDLYAIDLGDGNSAIKIAGPMPSPDTVALAFGKDRLGGAERHLFQMGLWIDVSTRPAVKPYLGCDGDLGEACYVGKKLIPSLVAKKAAYAALKLPSQYLAKLGARGKNRRFQTASVSLKKRGNLASVPRDACTASPESCGEVYEIPLLPYQKVVVGNERGDVYYERFQLYDPKRKLFVSAMDPKVVSPKPLKGKGVDMPDLWIAPSGQAYIADGKVITLKAGQAHAGSVGCGWSGGGVHVKGTN